MAPPAPIDQNLIFRRNQLRQAYLQAKKAYEDIP